MSDKTVYSSFFGVINADKGGVCVAMMMRVAHELMGEAWRKDPNGGMEPEESLPEICQISLGEGFKTLATHKEGYESCLKEIVYCLALYGMWRGEGELKTVMNEGEPEHFLANLGNLVKGLQSMGRVGNSLSALCAALKEQESSIPQELGQGDPPGF